MKRLLSILFAASVFYPSCAAQPQRTAQAVGSGQRIPDAVQDAQTPRSVAETRPEQKKTDIDDPKRFASTNARPSSPVFKNQPDEGKVQGFDFFRDPLNAKRPMQSPAEIRQSDEEAKAQVMADQQKLLASRYNLTPQTDP